MEVYSGNVGLKVPSLNESDWGRKLNDETFSLINQYLNEIYDARGGQSNLKARMDLFLLASTFEPYKDAIDNIDIGQAIASDITVLRKYILWNSLGVNCIISGTISSGSTGSQYYLSFTNTVYVSDIAGVNIVNGKSGSWATNASGMIYLSGGEVYTSAQTPATLDDASNIPAGGVPVAFYSGSYVKVGAFRRYVERTVPSVVLTAGWTYAISGFNFGYRLKHIETILYDSNAGIEYDLRNIITARKVGRYIDAERIDLMANHTFASGADIYGSGLFMSGNTMINTLNGELRVRIYG